MGRYVVRGFSIEFSDWLPEHSFIPMDRLDTKLLPEFSADRLLNRTAEAMQVALDPAKIKEFPVWTQRVMQILRDQFIPREYASILSGDGSFFTEGIAVAWAAKASDLAQVRGPQGGGFAQVLAERLGMDAKAQAVAMQVEAGTFTTSPEFQKHVMNRLFAQDFSARRAFVEGLAIGNRLPELLNRQAKSNTTDATTIYLLLWIYWPEISKMKSLPQVARALETYYTENRNLAGAHWEERIRKLANRIGLSFRAKQQRRRRVAPK